MKRKAIALTFISALLISSSFIPLVAKAQAPEPPNVDTLGPVVFSYQSGNVVILSPRDSTTYENPIQLNFTVEATGMFGQFGNVGVSVDGGVINSVTDFINKSKVQSGPDWYWYRTTVFASVMLPTLSEGNHNVTVYYGWQYLGTNNPSLQRYEVFAYATVNFVVADVTAPIISIQSPRNSIYNAADIELTFLVNEKVAWMGYSLDGGDNITVSNNMTLAGLFNGIHCLTIYANDTFGNMGVSETVNFTVELVIEVLSPETRTYETSSVPLNFTVNAALAQITYCLNGEENVTISGNTTLTGLANGDYALTVYAKDEAGNVGTSETILFTVNLPFPTLVIVSVITIAVVGIGLLVYFKKRQRSPNP